MNQWVDITFDCLPHRSFARVDIPLDASPKYRQRCQRIKDALEKHGTLNAYYLVNAHCIFHLANHDDVGRIEFRFEGTALTNETDQQTNRCDLNVELVRETCDWLTEPIVEWFKQSVERAVKIEFDRYIAAGDLQQTVARIDKIQAESDESGGFVGMYL